jgi:hypothetical protein
VDVDRDDEVRAEFLREAREIRIVPLGAPDRDREPLVVPFAPTPPEGSARPAPRHEDVRARRPIIERTRSQSSGAAIPCAPPGVRQPEIELLEEARDGKIAEEPREDHDASYFRRCSWKKSTMTPFM